MTSLSAYPVIAIVGRPNVGKSTLFNYITQSRDALVAQIPGLTRDRIYGRGQIHNKPFIIIDTGGLTGEEIEMDGLIAKQTWAAISESTFVLFVVEARTGLTHLDESIAKQLRKIHKKTMLVVNKSEGLNSEIAASDFYRLGFGKPHPIASAHGEGIEELFDEVLKDAPDIGMIEKEAAQIKGTKVAIVGKPNAGKSTLVNRILGEERMVVSEEPGTTRDSIYIPMVKNRKNYVIIDTAGVRRRSRVSDKIEKFSVIKTLQAIAEADVVVALIDARVGIVDQDLKLLGFILEAGKALVIAVNKWDGLSIEEKDAVKHELDRRLSFVNFARMYFISALHGTAVGDLFKGIDEAQRSASRKLATPELTQLLEKAVDQHQPPLVKGRRVKLRYAHAGGQHPPLIIVHGTRVESLPSSYHRYLSNFFREELNLVGTPVWVELKNSSQR